MHYLYIPWPKVYPILDASFIPPTYRGDFLYRLGSSLADAGVTMLEYRNKTGLPNDRSSSVGWKTGAEAELLADAEILRAVLPVGQVKLILDDRADLVKKTGFDGAHVDAGDLTPTEARRLLGPKYILGTFGGSDEFIPEILEEPIDYFSIGPVFPTRTKQISTPPIGIEGVRKLSEIAGENTVPAAVGGITLPTAAAALAAGAKMVAVAGAIFRQPDPAAEFRRWMAELG
jgi:thiamine-phosphate pyrophosphorylase